VKEGHIGDDAANNWVAAMMGLYRTITGKEPATSVGAPGRRNKGKAGGGPLIRFLATAGQPLGLSYSEDAWRSRVRTFLKGAPRHHVGVPADQVATLKRLAGNLPEVPFDLTRKNKALLRQLESDRPRAALLFLPEQLLAKAAQALKRNSALPFVEAQVEEVAMTIRNEHLRHSPTWRRSSEAQTFRPEGAAIWLRPLIGFANWRVGPPPQLPPHSMRCLSP